MPSINLDNLERYDSKARNEAEEEYMPKDSGNWQKTEEAGAVQFYPVGGSPLEGKVKFSFTETPPASGEKSPTNPSTISGVSSIGLTVCQEEGVDEHEYAIDLGGTYYGGSIDLATGLMTVTHEVRYVSPNITFNISSFRENSNSYGLYFTPTYAMRKTGVASDYVCNYFDVVYNNYQPSKSAIMVANSNYGMFLFLDKQEFSLSNGLTMAEVIEAVRPWFEGKEVRFYYPLATPQTVQISNFAPPQIRALTQPDKCTPRLNTVYTDADTIQIGYMKSSQRTEQEITQALLEIESNGSD